LIQNQALFLSATVPQSQQTTVDETLRQTIPFEKVLEFAYGTV